MKENIALLGLVGQATATQPYAPEHNPEPEPAEEVNPYHIPGYEAELSEVEDQLLVFMQRGYLLTFYYDTEQGQADILKDGVTPEEVEAERALWVAAHREQAEGLREFLAAHAWLAPSPTTTYQAPGGRPFRVLDESAMREGRRLAQRLIRRFVPIRRRKRHGVRAAA